jgi:NAD(P)H-hydrate epimerase
MKATSLYTVAQVHAFEREAIEVHGVAGYVLMQRAAAAAFGRLQACWPHARSIAVVCGGGNNGGDGYVLARLAHAAKLEVHVVALDPPRAGGDAARARSDWTGAGGGVLDAEAELPLADVYVDAIFGTGLTRPPSVMAARWIERLNAAGRPVLALDVPSGLDADTGTYRESLCAPPKRSLSSRASAVCTPARPAIPPVPRARRPDIPAVVFANARADADLAAIDVIRAWLPPRLAMYTRYF